MKLNNILRYKDLDKCPWQKPALDLLDHFFPTWEKMSDAELLNIENSNPKTMARVDSLWNGIPIYFNQRDNYTMPDRTCNSSSNAMYLLSFAPWLLWDKGDNEFLNRVLAYGDTIYHENQTKVLADYGVKTIWKNDKNETKLLELCKVKTPSTVNILHRGIKGNYRGGHVILIYDFDVKTQEYIYQDPYGNIKTNYQVGSNGRSNRMTRTEFMNRWQGGYRLRA